MNTVAFAAANKARCQSQEGFNHKLSDWSLSDWMVALGGEVGEAMNIVKKLNRYRDSIAGNKESEVELQSKLLRELADVYIYLDLLFQVLGRDLGQCVIGAFNAKSQDVGYPHMYKEE